MSNCNICKKETFKKVTVDNNREMYLCDACMSRQTIRKIVNIVEDEPTLNTDVPNDPNLVDFEFDKFEDVTNLFVEDE